MRDTNNPRLLSSRITAIEKLGSEQYLHIPVLNFEGKDDYWLAERSLQRSKKILKNVKYEHLAYSEGKTEAVENHLHATKIGLKVSTIVDMDHDFRDKEISQRIEDTYVLHPNVRSTKPSCVLITMLLRDKGSLEKSIKAVPILKDPTRELIDSIIKFATKKTLDVYKEQLKYNNLINRFLKVNPNPLNDHNLCVSIYLHRSGKYKNDGSIKKYRDIPEKDRYQIEESLERSAIDLGYTILIDTMESMLDLITT